MTYTLPAEIPPGSYLDLRRAELQPTEEGGLRLSLAMAEVLAAPEAPNGFDLAALHVFLDFPGQEGGATVLPGLNAQAPEGFAWDYAALLTGQEARLLSANGADAESLGTPLVPVPEVAVDAQAGLIDVFFPAAALGNPPSWDGLTAYVSTWGWDGTEGAYFDLAPDAGPFTFGGGEAATDPLIADDPLLGTSRPYVSPLPPTPEPQVIIIANVPESTPQDAQLYLSGPFNEWAPGDETYRLRANQDGTYSLTFSVPQGTVLEYRITRGSFANAEKFDPDDRFANLTLEVPDVESMEVPIEVQGWWDQ